LEEERVIERALLTAAATGAVVALSACGSSSPTTGTTPTGGVAGATAPTPTPAAATIAVGTDAKLGKFLVDAAGRSLYLFEADTSTASTCSGACAQTWPPLTTGGAPQAGSGATQSKLGTTMRSDGSTQVTYNGHPLYSFAGDSKPGDLTGEGNTGFGAGWDVVSPAGAKIEASGG
jgi:predicted lipoprotein with Yx(FWY)xxD motif